MTNTTDKFIHNMIYGSTDPKFIKNIWKMSDGTTKVELNPDIDTPWFIYEKIYDVCQEIVNIHDNIIIVSKITPRKIDTKIFRKKHINTINIGRLDSTFVMIDNGISGIMYELDEPISGYDILWEDQTDESITEFFLTNFENSDNPKDGGVMVYSVDREVMDSIEDNEDGEYDFYIEIDLGKL